MIDNKYLNSLPIDVNGNDVSDVIKIEDNVFRNMMTKKTSQNIKDVIRDGKRYILYSKDMLETSDGFTDILTGHYVFFDREASILCVSKVKFYEKSGKWKEDWRFAISKEQCTLGNTGPESVYINVDICGQGKIVENGHIINYPVELVKRVEDFFGGAFALSTYNSEMDIYDLGNCNTLHILADAFLSDKRNSPDIMFGDRIVSGGTTKNTLFIRKSPYKRNLLIFDETGKKTWGYKNLLMPTEAEQELEIFKKRWRIFYTEYQLKEPPCVSILQKDKGAPVLRHFMLLFRYNAYAENQSYVEAVEYQRDYFGENLHRINKGGALIWHDDMSGTSFQYTVKILDELINNHKNMKQIEWVVNDMHDKMFENNYGIEDVYAVRLAYYIGKDSLFEKVLSAYKGTDIAKRLSVLVCKNGWSIHRALLCVFGDFNREEKTLDGILGFPKGMINIFLEKGLAEELRPVKIMFGQDEELANYLRRMNQKDIVYFANILHKAKQNNPKYPDIGTNLFECLHEAISVYGVQNWKEIIKWAAGMLTSDFSIFDYFDYMQSVKDLYDAEVVPKDHLIAKCPWRFNHNDELERSKCFAEEVLAVKDNYAEAYKLFKEYQREWANYDFEDKDYLISCPKEPFDVINEGLSLNHCACSFIPSIAYKSSILLFLRRKTNPDAPFFTIELKDNKIRQIHGYNNCTIEKENELKKFMIKFCKKKKIEYSEGNELYGPHV